MDEQKKLLYKILGITQTEDNKEAFIEMFLALIFEETASNLIHSLPAKRRDSVAMKWDANKDNPAALVSLLKHNFSEKQMVETSEKTAEKAMREYLQSIDGKLTEVQKERLRALAESAPISIS